MVVLPKWYVELTSKSKVLQLLDNPKTIGEHIKRNRVALRLKQREVADIIGVSEDCITYWENERSKPQRRHYHKIIKFLGYNPFANRLQ